VTEEPRQPSAAATAAEKVRAIVEAAERSAAELEAAAREDAARIRAEAERNADARLAGVREAAARLAERTAELERQVTAVRESIASLVTELGELRGSGVARDRAPAREDAAPVESEAVDEGGPAEGGAGTEGVRSEGGWTEGARVIALNMALNGTPREQTARYLAENFELDDPEALLDDVYARAGGQPAGS
jgi:hypothetical protein